MALMLLTTLPGMQGRVLESVARVPGVATEQLLCGEEIAVRLCGTEAGDDAPAKLACLDGVLEARLYRGAEAWLLRRSRN